MNNSVLFGAAIALAISPSLISCTSSQLSASTSSPSGVQMQRYSDANSSKSVRDNSLSFVAQSSTTQMRRFFAVSSTTNIASSSRNESVSSPKIQMRRFSTYVNPPMSLESTTSTTK